MRALLLLTLVLTAGPASKSARPPASKGRPAPAAVPDAGVDAPIATAAVLEPSAIRHVVKGETKCGSCHVTSSWIDVKFNHERTGFPLLGGHATTSCRGCHAEDFVKPVPTTCAGCHRDVHASDLGLRCEGCHDERSWASRFDADAHRRTAFPLVGAHATIPCLECHAEASARRFARPAVECNFCHKADLESTRGSGIDHFALGFTQSCRTCHNAFRFTPAVFPGHDACYFISSGPHAGARCLGCHKDRINPSPPGSCSTGTAACSECHEHLCSGPTGTLPTDLLHQPPKTAARVPGYACGSPKCYRCHKEVATP